MLRTLAVLTLLVLTACQDQYDISIVVPVDNYSPSSGDNVFLSTIEEHYTIVNFAVAGSDQVSIADFNDDSQLDIVATHRVSRNNAVYLNIGDGKHTMATSLNSRSVSDADCGDINADGFDDIVVMSSRDYPVIRYGIGDGGFGVSQFSDRSMHCVSVGDLDNNGYADVVVGGSEGLEIWWSSATSFASERYETGEIQDLLCADVNGDGRLDIIVSEVSKQWISLNKGDGLFEDIEIGAYTTSDMQAADVNNDGLVDFFFANTGEPSVLLLQKNGLTFHSYIVGPNITHTDGCCLIDFDQDGRMDIIVTNVETQTQTLFRNTGAWFSKHERLGKSTRALVAGDLNNDGKPDLILANSNDSMNEIWLSK